MTTVRFAHLHDLALTPLGLHGHRPTRVPASSNPRTAVSSSAVAAAVAVTGCGSSNHNNSSSGTRSAAKTAASTWSLPNANLQNTRQISSSITSANVSKLRVAWRIPLTQVGAYGYYANTPVFGEGETIYFLS